GEHGACEHPPPYSSPTRGEGTELSSAHEPFLTSRVPRDHRAISQVVPSLESLSTTPMAASSSRMRSDSLKFFAFRAALRAAIKASTAALSMLRLLSGRVEKPNARREGPRDAKLPRPWSA